jgi:O-antigen/teichoic acid export membrane protein
MVAHFVFTLLALPVAKRAVGTDLFVAYGMMNVVMVWFGTANIAAGPYLSLKIPNALVARSEGRALAAISAAFAVAASFGLVIIVAFTLPGVRHCLARLIGANSGTTLLRTDVTDAILVVAFAAAAGTVIGVAEEVRQGLQERHIATMWSAAGVTGATIAIVIVSAMAPDLVMLVAAALITPLIGRMVNAILLWYRHHPRLRPRLGDVGLAGAIEVLKTNGLYTAVQSSGLLGAPIALILVSRYETAGVAAGFYVTMLLSGLAGSVVSALLSPMLPALADASASNDLRWVRRGIWAVMGVALVAGLGLLVLFALGAPIIGMLYGSDAVPSLSVRLLMGVYFGLVILESAFYTVGLAFLSHRRLAFVAISRGLVTLLLLAIVTPTHGAVGAAVALLVGIVATSVWSYSVMFVRLNSKLRSEARPSLPSKLGPLRRIKEQ